MSDWTSLQQYLHERVHPHLLFKIRDEDDVFPTKIRTTIIFGSGDSSHFAETETNLQDMDLEQWYEDNLKRMTLEEAENILKDEHP